MRQSNSAFKTSRIGFLVLVSLFLFNRGMAQTACTQQLDQARTLFDDGQIQLLPGILENCLATGGFTEAEQTEALRLLVLTHIYMEEPTRADQRMLELLNHEHEYQINEAVDPTEFILLYETFRTWPIFSVGIKGGLNASIVNPVEINGTFDLTGTDRGTYTPNIGFQGGLSFEFDFKGKFSKFTLNPELQLTILSFDKESKVPFASNGVLDINSLLVVENQTWIHLPVVLQYKLPSNKFNPYLFLGPEVGYLLASNTAGDLTEVEYEENQNVAKGSIDLIDERESINFSAVGGGGIKLKLGEGHFVAEIRFGYGILDLVKGNAFYNTSTGWELLNANDQFRLNTLGLSLKYIKDIYKPIKLTK